MAKLSNREQTCSICGRSFPSRSMIPGAVVRESIASLNRREHPDWSADSFVCQTDLTRYRSQYIHSLLESEKGELTSLEQEVVRSLREHEVLSSNVDAEFEHEWTFGERMVDRIAVFGGSWTFLISFFVFLVIWISVNSILLLGRPLDPFPYILLNLILSCLAAIQAPITMMSQNRQEAKDRLRSQHDYQVNTRNPSTARKGRPPAVAPMGTPRADSGGSDRAADGTRPPEIARNWRIATARQCGYGEHVTAGNS